MLPEKEIEFREALDAVVRNALLQAFTEEDLKLFHIDSIFLYGHPK